MRPRVRRSSESLLRACQSMIEPLEQRMLLSVNVLTWHNDLTRQGWNNQETQLTTANVNASTFGQLFSYPVDGQIYAQPLYVSSLAIPGKGTHNVVFVATEHDSVYAFDADSNGGGSGGLLWQASLGTSASVPNDYFGNRYGPYHDISPEVGITSTPVIDLASGTMYVDAFTEDGTGLYSHRIHALNITTGQDRVSPAFVAASAQGNADDSVSGKINFVASQHLQRPALTLANGTLYVAYSGYADTEPYHGWILGFNPTSLSLTSVFNTTPNNLKPPSQFPSEGGIWQTGNGLVSDGTSLYLITGNGDFNPGLNDWGDTVLKLSPAASTLNVADYFTPNNQAALSAADEDLGSGGAMLLPTSVGSAAHPNLLIGCGKQGLIYVMDRSNLGKFNSGFDAVMQEVSLSGHGTWSNPAYFNGSIYYHAQGDVLKAFSISDGAMSAAPTSQSTIKYGYPGATPSVSSNGNANGIVWDVQYDSTHAILHAYDATNVANELYNSNQNTARDQLDPGVKFITPMIADGKVFVGTSDTLAVFGLLGNITPGIPNAPTNLTATVITPTQVLLQWTDNSDNETGFKIERSTDGTNFSQLDFVGANVTTYTDNGVTPNTQYYYRVRATNAAGDSAYSNVATAQPIGNADPIYEYKFDEGGGTSTVDSISANNGTLSGNPLPQWVRPGRIGYSDLSFSGDQVYSSTLLQSAVTTQKPLSQVLNGTASLTAWIKTTRAGGPGAQSPAITGATGTADGVLWGYIDSGGHVGVAAGMGTPVASAASINDGQWHAIALTRNATTGVIQVYVDGVLSATAIGDAGVKSAVFNTLGAATDLASNGSVSGMDYFNGELDDIKIYGKVLSAGQISDLGQIPPAPLGFVATAVSGTIVHLTWDPLPAYVTGIEVQRADGPTGPFRQIATLSGTAISYDDTTVSPAIQYFYRIRASDDAGIGPYSTTVSVVPPGPGVVANTLFYNRSLFDGHNGSSNIADSFAIAKDKQALLPGQTASFANISSYSKGINGIIIDVANLGNVTPTLADFTFKMGTGGDPSTWKTAPMPDNPAVYPGQGIGGSTRIELIWPDYSITNTWLQVTMPVNPVTGLARPDVFYFGSLVGYSGGSLVNNQFKVTSADELSARHDPHPFFRPAPITNVNDFNRDGKVDATDQIIARNNGGAALDVLQLAVRTAVRKAVRPAPRLAPRPATRRR